MPAEQQATPLPATMARSPHYTGALAEHSERKRHRIESIMSSGCIGHQATSLPAVNAGRPHIQTSAIASHNTRARHWFESIISSGGHGQQATSLTTTNARRLHIRTITLAGRNERASPWFGDISRSGASRLMRRSRGPMAGGLGRSLVAFARRRAEAKRRFVKLARRRKPRVAPVAQDAALARRPLRRDVLGDDSRGLIFAQYASDVHGPAAPGGWQRVWREWMKGTVEASTWNVCAPMGQAFEMGCEARRLRCCCATLEIHPHKSDTHKCQQLFGIVDKVAPMRDHAGSHHASTSRCSATRVYHNSLPRG
mmetsp:Transcript_146328/g.469429  ORF Transcript_146328/g.469429 Transcript_146328/m.469429 type:complete len:311 (-) Transcript_146328:50-982(-)